MNKNAQKLKELLGMSMDMKQSTSKPVKKKTSKKSKKKGSVK